MFPSTTPLQFSTVLKKNLNYIIYISKLAKEYLLDSEGCVPDTIPTQGVDLWDRCISKINPETIRYPPSEKQNLESLEGNTFPLSFSMVAADSPLAIRAATKAALTIPTLPVAFW